MKNVFIKYISLISLFIYPLKLEEKINMLLNMIYSGRIRGAFKRCGKGFLCERKVRLWHPQFIELGNYVHIFNSSILAVHKDGLTSKNGQINIGNNVVIGEGTHISSASQIVIGNNVLMGRRCTITDNSHGRSTANDLKIAPNKRPVVPNGNVYVGNNVWLGDNVVVLPGVHIGEGCIIGASTVVTHSTPLFCMCRKPGKGN